MAKKRKRRIDKTRPRGSAPNGPESAASKEGEEPAAKSRQSDVPTKRSAKPPELAHDDSEIQVGAILKISGSILGVTAVVMAAMWFFNDVLAERERVEHPELPPMASVRPTLPPTPLLQAKPRAGLEAVREHEEQVLGSYGWVERNDGIARIPIDRAMEIVAERGLPTREEGPPDVEPVTVPTEASLGVAREADR